MENKIKNLTFSSLKKRIEKIHRENLVLFLKSQYLQEKEFTRQYEDTKELIEIGNIVKRLKNFDINKIIKLNKSEFFSEEQVNFFKYFSKSILKFDKRNYRFYNRLRYWFRNFSTLSSGSYGKVYSASLRGSKEKLFVFKFSKINNPCDEIIDKALIFHEYFVSHYFINNLRKKCPNFSMTFGFLECSTPDIIFGTQFQAVPCIVYENVHPSETIYRFIKRGIHISDFMSVFIQICLALYTACLEFGFTHNDLHLGNVLIKEHKETLYIPYYYKGRKIYVKGKYLAVIIDYGMSRIEIKRENFGPFGVPRKSLNEYTKAYPVKDIFSILSCCYIELCPEEGGKGGELCRLIKEILNLLIDKDTTYDQISEVPDLSLFYPYFEEIDGIKGIEYILDYILKNMHSVIKDVIVEKVDSSTSGMILDCKYTTCHTLEEIYDSTYRKLPIKDVFYYLDLRIYNPNITLPEDVLKYNLDILKENIKEIENYELPLSTWTDPRAIDSQRFIKYYVLSKDTIELYKALEIFTGSSSDDETKSSRNASNEVLSLNTRISKIRDNVNKAIRKLTTLRDNIIFTSKEEIDDNALHKLIQLIPPPVL